jgi:pimeloyl-ACP methyl ester carboxylesterase
VTKRVSLHGIEMAYEEHGAGTRPLVVVHGFTGSRRDFAWRFADLATLGRTIFPDLRGHGDSTNTGDPATYTLEQIADDLVAFLDAIGVASCDLLGHSMGGMAALRTALRAPERIDSLILMDTSAHCPPGIPRDIIALAGRIAREAGPRKLVEIMRERAPTEPSRTAADRRVEAAWGEGYWSEWRYPNFEALDPEVYGAFGAAILDQPSLASRLGEIRCPTLVMVGEGDTAFLDAAGELAAGIPGARRFDVPDAGHQPQFENPAAWVAAIREHLARVRG